MAVIQVSTSIKGEAKTQAAIGARYTVSAHCIGRASAARPSRDPVPVPKPEPKKGV